MDTAASAHAILAWCFHFRFSRGGLREEDRVASVRHARAAQKSGSDDAAALALAGLVHFFDAHDSAVALKMFDQAMAISSSNVSGALSPSCAVRSDPEDVADLDWIGSHIWLTI
jgi:hypothetical protein